MVPEIRARELKALRELRRQPRLDLQDPIPVLLHFSPIGRQDALNLLAAQGTQRPFALLPRFPNAIRLQTRSAHTLVIAGEEHVVAGVAVAHHASW